MLAANTLEFLQTICDAGEVGISRQQLREACPNTASTTLIARLKDLELISGEIPENGRKSDEELTITPTGIQRLDYYKANPARIAKNRTRRKTKRESVKVPSNMDDAMRAHLENEAQIGRDNEVINGVIQTIYGTIVAGLENVPEVEESQHPMRQHNRELRLKLVAIKEQLENDFG